MQPANQSQYNICCDLNNTAAFTHALLLPIVLSAYSVSLVLAWGVKWWQCTFGIADQLIYHNLPYATATPCVTAVLHSHVCNALLTLHRHLPWCIHEPELHRLLT